MTLRFKLPPHFKPRFLEELNTPLHPLFHWRERKPAKEETSFAKGIRIGVSFPDPHKVLTTALDDFLDFLASLKIPQTEASELRFRLLPQLKREEHRITVCHGMIEISASDTEGVRRALVWIEDEMLRREGPFLPLGVHQRYPVIRTRLSRCFFGPINRPPSNRDELLDDINYYPDSYLNRLAHEGVNGLWLTIRFRDTVPSTLLPDYGRDAEKRLEKLRWVVARCACYGIKVYCFCIEPAALPTDSPIFKKHPELKGHVQDGMAAFCTSSALGKEYLEEAGRVLFEKVPDLGGMIVIPVGERFSHCYSLFLPESGRSNRPCNCCRCSRRSPHEVLHDALAALRRGIDKAAPEAELIAWPYGQLVLWGPKATINAAKHVPERVILQHNFETGGVNFQLGKERPLWDYWLSWAGPSSLFSEIAKTSAKHRISAKLQVGCSHEIATVPFVPVPGLLYQKYDAMHRLGVSAAMQSWYFGNYPSLMTKAAGELSFAPFPEKESDFLLHLARRDWGAEASDVVTAWTLFRKAYENYPASHLFGYYGPMQDGVTWPLHLIPRNAPLAPTWMAGYKPSGDYLADCIGSFFTLEEVVTLSRRMVRLWKKGQGFLEKAFLAHEENRARLLEVSVARAIGLQFESGLAILRFYQVREELMDTSGREALRILDAMEAGVRTEIARRLEMIEYCRIDPRLGYHSEAEGFKVTPALIRRGIASLERLLAGEFPLVRDAIMGNRILFGDYTGKAPKRRPYAMPMLSYSEARGGVLNGEVWKKVPALPLRNLLVQAGSNPSKNSYGSEWARGSREEVPINVRFKLLADAEAIHLQVEIIPSNLSAFSLLQHPEGLEKSIATVTIDIEPGRLRPRIQFNLDSEGCKRSLLDDSLLAATPPPFEAYWSHSDSGVEGAVLSIPWQSLGMKSLRFPFRLNVKVLFFNAETGRRYELSWMRRSPLKARLVWGDANPATDYRWCVAGPVV